MLCFSLLNNLYQYYLMYMHTDPQQLATAHNFLFFFSQFHTGTVEILHRRIKIKNGAGHVRGTLL